MRLVSFASITLSLALSSAVLAEVKMPAIFGDHMVLQRSARVPLWGTADPGEAITVTAGDARAHTTARPDGKWSATIENLKASDRPIDVTVAGKNSLSFHDVLVGDVWVCSGQSNMELTLRHAHNAEEALAHADRPTLRLFVVDKKVSLEARSDCAGHWRLCSSDTAQGFSAVGYFFACDIQEDQHVPVGMIGTYWGGTPAEAWTSLAALQAVPSLNELAKAYEDVKSNLPEHEAEYLNEAVPKWQKRHDAWQASMQSAAAATMPARREPRKPPEPDKNPRLPTVLSKGMLTPIIPFAIKGVIWYQGEENTGKPEQYATLFPTMVADWRARWGQGDFPFIWVQLPNHLARSNSANDPSADWARLRDAQSKTLKLPNTAQAVTIDIGEADDIHPKDKLDVGKRLALAARHVAYGETLVYCGPTFDSMKIGGDKVIVKFRNVGTGLTIAAAPSMQMSVPRAEPASDLRGFAISSDNRSFVWATGNIDGDSIIVSSPQVAHPVAVRYGWANNPEVNLYNKEGLPACPFRTDDWGE